MPFTFTPRRAALSAVAGATLAFAGATQAQQIIGLTSTNALITFVANAPANGSAQSFITGLEGTNQRILAIDTRPTNGLIYGVSTDSKLYTLNATNGIATKVADLSIALNGTAFGFDFNPVADTNGAASLRIVSNTGQNLAVNAVTGAATVQTALTYNDNDANPATSTVGLYFIDSQTDGLYFTGAPAGGALSFIGGLGFNTTGVLGFDIAGVTNMAYAGLTLDGTDTGKSGLYAINLGTGAATLIGDFGIGGNTAISPPLLGLTVVGAIPEPGTYALMLAGLAGVGWMARRRTGTRASA
jgi:hypothetical protein